MTMIPEVPFSELVNRPKATTAKLAESRAHELRLRRRDDVDLVLRESEADQQRTEMVNTAARFLRALVPGGEEETNMARKIVGGVFPWVRYLPEADVQTFLAEFADVLRATEHFDNPAPAVHQFVIEWQHTAEVYADPEVLAALTRERDPDADSGPVPPPFGVVE
ncbi:hypothetical protein [Nocardiopsis halotolerans]|uniref:hypothetical protein n=1 Tax=Nocardiopsis halotolerans TaxID=124252 RepID=UPI000365ADCD|nr:hypothetical protein [Nocardiopsis halotolerans]